MVVLVVCFSMIWPSFFFYMSLAPHDISFAGIELNHVAQHVQLRVISL